MNCYFSRVASLAPWRHFISMARMIFSPMNSPLLIRSRAALFATLLVWLTPRAARAENSITYKYEGYDESGGRIGVQTRGAYIEQDLGTEMHLKLEGLIDAIAGATPSGQPAPAGSDQVVL